MWPKIGLWIAGHSWREIAAACAVLFIGLFCAYEVHHQRAIGYDEAKAEDAKANEAAQVRADKAAAPANKQLRVDYDQVSQPLPGYLQIYGDKSKPPDCPSVSYQRKLKP